MPHTQFSHKPDAAFILLPFLPTLCEWPKPLTSASLGRKAQVAVMAHEEDTWNGFAHRKGCTMISVNLHVLQAPTSVSDAPGPYRYVYSISQL